MTGCRLKRQKDIWMILIGCAILIALGIMLGIVLPEEQHELQTFAGMITGFGTGVAAVAIVKMIQMKRSTPEQLKAREIEEKDERNIRIRQMAFAVTAVASFIILAILSFVCTLLGEFLITCIVIAAMYVQILVYVIAQKVIAKRI